MTSFTLYSAADAPEASREFLHAAEAKFGFVPNVLRQMAESPTAVGGVLQLMGLMEHSSLAPAEVWTALLVVARENTSDYCVAANSTVAQMMGVPQDVIDGVRQGESLENPKFEALRVLTREMVQRRGLVGSDAIESFLSAGFTKAQFLDVILAISLETLASYTDRALATPLDGAYQAQVWSRQAEPIASR